VIDYLLVALRRKKIAEGIENGDLFVALRTEIRIKTRFWKQDDGNRQDERTSGEQVSGERTVYACENDGRNRKKLSVPRRDGSNDASILDRRPTADDGAMGRSRSGDVENELRPGTDTLGCHLPVLSRTKGDAVSVFI
jgi:hypothetical protein